MTRTSRPAARVAAGVIPPLAIPVLLAAILLLAACGKKAAPDPPGPPDQITYPRPYPSR